MFKRLDTSADSRLSVTEFKAALPLLRRWGVVVDDVTAEFDKIDSDRGGMILFKEFSDWALLKGLDLEDDTDEPELEPVWQTKDRSKGDERRIRSARGGQNSARAGLQGESKGDRYFAAGAQPIQAQLASSPYAASSSRGGQRGFAASAPRRSHQASSERIASLAVPRENQAVPKRPASARSGGRQWKLSTDYSRASRAFGWGAFTGGGGPSPRSSDPMHAGLGYGYVSPSWAKPCNVFGKTARYGKQPFRGREGAPGDQTAWEHQNPNRYNPQAWAGKVQVLVAD